MFKTHIHILGSRTHMHLTESIVYQVLSLIIKTKMDKHVREFRLNCLYKTEVISVLNKGQFTLKLTFDVF